MFYSIVILSLTFPITTFAFPRETAIDNQVQPTHVVTAEPPGITEQGSLRCFDGATVLHTTDCTMGTPVSFCYKPQSPITCDEGYFPSVWHPDHCMQESTCFPTDADWITTECSNGALPISTETLYSGTLAGGDDAMITSVACACPSDQWRSVTTMDGASSFETYCMPTRSCPPGMTTSLSINEYCATASAAICSDLPAQADRCECVGQEMTPRYPEGPGATATGCDST
ncbi:hypothetical protein PEBR_10422 [Penicillium brasilianum]|uniref:Uncharacterized protein n=1 Tax=Penicillium brasilianum TaxID=104259 RepID=A0A1S9RUS4_PENBI|nr:hypothetical protein PEBR_10422 [Penicillium brasilianum]